MVVIIISSLLDSQHGSPPKQMVEYIGTIVVATSVVDSLQDDRPRGKGYRSKAFRQQDRSTIVPI